MPIPFTCPYCGRHTSVGDEYAGKTGPCGGCGASVTIPLSDPLNPYQSPETTWLPGDAAGQLRGGLAWILFSLDGRIPRRIWWIVSILKNVGLYGLMIACFALIEGGVVDPGVLNSEVLLLTLIVILAIPMMWIDIALNCKRFHDRDKSGWWYLISFVPYIGPLWILIECGCLRGTYGPNAYGPDPT